MLDAMVLKHFNHGSALADEANRMPRFTLRDRQIDSNIHHAIADFVTMRREVDYPHPATSYLYEHDLSVRRLLCWTRWPQAPNPRKRTSGAMQGEEREQPRSTWACRFPASETRSFPPRIDFPCHGRGNSRQRRP